MGAAAAARSAKVTGDFGEGPPGPFRGSGFWGVAGGWAWLPGDDLTGMGVGVRPLNVVGETKLSLV